MKKVLHVILISVLLIISCTKEATQDVLKVHSFFGDVTIQSRDVTRIPTIGDMLALNDVVIVGEGAIIDIVYRNTGIIRVFENTTIKVNSLVKGNIDDVVINIESGKMFATIGKLKKGDGFALKSKTVVASIRGTSFRMVSGEKGSSVDVVTGKVMVKPVSNNTVVEDVEVVVEENQTVALDTKTVETIVQKIEEKKAETTEKDTQQKIVEELKESIKPIETPKETIQEIKQEVKDIPIVAAVHEEVKQELRDVIEEDKESKKLEEEKLKKEKEKAEKAKQLKLEKEQQAKMIAQKLEQQRLEKEKAEREKAAKEQAEREKAAREQKLKEDRVKNIPTM